MSDLTLPELDALRALDAVATPGPVEYLECPCCVSVDTPNGNAVCFLRYDDPLRHANGKLIARTRNALPALLAMAERCLAAEADRDVLRHEIRFRRWQRSGSMDAMDAPDRFSVYRAMGETP